jgi:hypothetical protein
VNQERIILEEGYFLFISIGEIHFQSNPFEENVGWVYYGIATN